MGTYFLTSLKQKKLEFLNEEKIKEILDEVVELFLIPHFISKGMNASGEWKASLETEVRDGVGIIRGRKYTEQLVYGRRPGSFAPIQPLKKWAMIKLGLDERQALGAAFAISKNLEKEGNTYYKQGGTDLIEVLSQKQVIDFINTKTKKFIEISVEQQLKRTIEQAFK